MSDIVLSLLYIVSITVLVAFFLYSEAIFFFGAKHNTCCTVYVSQSAVRSAPLAVRSSVLLVVYSWFGRSVGGLVGGLVGRLVGRLVGGGRSVGGWGSVGWSAGGSVGGLVGRLVGRLEGGGRSAGQLVGRLVG